MPDDKPDVTTDLLAQLYGALDRLNAVATRVPAAALAATQLPTMPSMPTPGKITAVQISAVAGAVRAQRSTVAALRSSLDAFEQQLEVLERLLEPLESMSQSWAQLEQTITGAAWPYGGYGSSRKEDTNRDLDGPG